MSGASALLSELVTRVATLRPAPLLVLDLDGTLLDNRPRMRSILLDCVARWPELGWRELGAAVHARLSALDDDHIAYRIEDTLGAVGVRDRALVEDALAFWRERFFTDEYLPLDRPNPGAVAFVRRLEANGARIVYLTGRDVEHMARGTVASLHAHGFPVLAPRAVLCMKQDPAMRDLEHKLRAVPELEAQGRIMAFIDNDPRQCDAFAERYPDPDRFTILFGSSRPPEARPLHPAVRQLASF